MPKRSLGRFFEPSNYNALREFQIRQTEVGRATVLAVLAPGASSTQAEAFAHEVTDKLGGAMHINVEICDGIPSTQMGKRKFIDQHLDLTPYLPWR
jgi:hypothetical protein